MWPDDEENTKKPRYSAGTSSKLLVETNLDLENVRNDLYKLQERLSAITRDRDEISNKLREETTRTTQLEDTLRHRSEELVQERLLRENLGIDVETARNRCNQAEQGQRRLEQQLVDISSRQNEGNERNRVETLERRVQALQLENARLASVPERPPSRTSSIPVPKGRRPRSSSENRSPKLEEELQVCKVQLTEEKAKAKKLEMRARKAEEDVIRLENEKTAEAHKHTKRLERVTSALEESKEEIEALRLQLHSGSSQTKDQSQYDALSKQKASLEEQLQTLKEDRLELEKKLARKTTQCERLQEKLDECFFPSSTEGDLRQEIEILRKELESLRRSDKSSRRESVSQLRYMLEDRDREVSKLQERLKRRESSTADLAVQEERALRLLKEKEDVKDELAKAHAHGRYVDSQMQLKQQELKHAQVQVKELETALGKARTLNAQQQELYSQVVKSCSEAERRADDVERELSDLREEIANRSTLSEAAERNVQWAKALDRVAELEQELASRSNESGETPRRANIPLPAPPVLTFANESEMESVARLVVGLQRIREERDTLRGSVEFLSFELRAKEATLQRTIESQSLKWIRLLQAAEEDSVALRSELTVSERRLAKVTEDMKATIADSSNRIHQNRVMLLATLLALQRAHAQLDTADAGEHLRLQLQTQQSASLKEIAKLQSMVDSRDRALQTSEEKYMEAKRDLHEKTEALDTVKEQLQSLETRRDKLQTSLEEQIAALKNLERDHTAQAVHIQRLEEVNNIAREELYEARIEADQLRNDHLNTFAQEDSEAQIALQRHIEELDARIIRRNEQIGTQQNEIRRLDMNLRIAENAVEEVRKELGELRSQRDWLESDAQTVRDERNHAQRELDACRNELDILRAEFETQCAALKLSSQSRDVEVTTLIEVISSLALKARTAVHSSVKQESAEQTVQSITIASAEHPLRPTAEDHEIQIMAGRSSVTSETSQREQDLEKLLQEATSRGDTLAAQLRRSSEVAREEVANHTAVLEERIETLSTEVESLEDRLAEAQRHLDDVLQQNGELEDQVCTLETETLAATREHEEAMEKIRLQLEEVDQTRAQEKKEHLGLLDRFQVLEERCSNAEESAGKVQNLEAQISEQEGAKTKLLEEIDQLQATIEAKAVEIDDLTDRIEELDRLKEVLAVTSQELTAKRTIQADLEEELSSLRAMLDRAQCSLDQKQATVEHLEVELAAASERLETIPQLQAQVTALETTVTKLEAELYEAQQAASAAASTTVRDAEANVRIVELEETIAKMKSDNEELERVLTIKTQEIDEYDDRHIEILKDRKKLVTKIDVLNRKIRTMQKQLDSAVPGSAQVAESVTETPAAAPAYFAPSHFLNPVASVQRTPPQEPAAAEPVTTKHSLPRASSAPLSTISSSGSRRVVSVSTESMPVSQTTPKTLSSSSPPAPIASAPFIVSTTISQQAPEAPTVAPPSTSSVVQSSLNRKRRMPEDFDPAADGHMPAMPVLSTTPGRLRKALREGLPPRTGFTPSRSRKNSATTAHDEELANAASAAIASLGLAGKLMQENTPLSTAPLKANTTSSRPPLNPKSSAELNSANSTTRSKLLPSSSVTGPTSSASKGETTSSVAKVRSGGWLTRTGKGSTSTKATSTAAARRVVRAIDTSPTLGSGVMPKRSLYVPPLLPQDFA
ncbi:hypothetical protein FRC17_006717 [Serendipita sp. 399]|nr:hypothetical protein FRC17_006717 [Serendipita sp. 399]